MIQVRNTYRNNKEPAKGRGGLAHPLALIVLDGWGCAAEVRGNAIALAQTPNFDQLLESFPHTTLDASGEAVGLPEGQMGNSEVGHLNIGAGRVVYQDITRISRAIRDRGVLQQPGAAAGHAGGRQAPVRPAPVRTAV